MLFFFFWVWCVLNCTNDCKICHCVRSFQSVPLYQENHGNDQLQDFIAWLYFPDKKRSKYSVYRSTARFCGMAVFSRQKAYQMH